MRLILCNIHTHIIPAGDLALPEGHFLFECFEDFSVGPLRDWNDPPKFFQNRSDFWKTTQTVDLLDGDKINPFVWFQAWPRYDLVELDKSGVPIDDIPLPKDIDDLLPQADRIEIWSDHTVNGCLFVWYLCALFEMTGIDQDRVSISHFSDSLRNERSPRFWSDMLMDTSKRSIPARPISKAIWQLMVQYWEVATRMPSAVDPALEKEADKHTLHAFKILKGRHSNPTNGLTNIQERLIRAAPKKWAKMILVIANAMGCGRDEKDWVGANVLQFELENMSRMVPPLFEISGTGAMRYCEVRLTKYGEKKQEQINC